MLHEMAETSIFRGNMSLGTMTGSWSCDAEGLGNTIPTTLVAEV